MLGHGGASSKAMECHYLLSNLRILHCSGAVPPVVAPQEVRRQAFRFTLNAAVCAPRVLHLAVKVSVNKFLQVIISRLQFYRSLQ